MHDTKDQEVPPMNDKIPSSKRWDFVFLLVLNARRLLALLRGLLYCLLYRLLHGLLYGLLCCFLGCHNVHLLPYITVPHD